MLPVIISLCVHKTCDAALVRTRLHFINTLASSTVPYWLAGIGNWTVNLRFGKSVILISGSFLLSVVIDINSCDTISSVKLQDSDFVLEFDGSFMDQKSSLSMSNLTSFQCNHQAVFGKCTSELEDSRMVSDF